MIGMEMGFQNINQFQTQFPDQFQVPWMLLQNWIDGDCIQRLRVKNQITVGPAFVIE